MRNRLGVASLVLVALALPVVAAGATISPGRLPVAVARPIISQPASGAMYTIGNRVKIVWNAAAIHDPWFNAFLVIVTPYQRSGAFQFQNTGSNDGFLVGAVDPLGKYYVEFQSYGGKLIAKSGTFEVLAGIIKVTAPAAGQFLEIGKPFTIRWDGSPVGPPNATVWLQVYSVALGKSGGGYPVSNSGAFEWTPTAYDKGQNKILISTSDNKFKGESGVFTIGFKLQPGAVFQKK